jgi:competence protein ComEC
VRWLDLRLVPVAATVWIGSLIAPALQPGMLVATAVAASALAGLLAARFPAPLGRAAAAVLVALAVAAACAAVRGESRFASPLGPLARSGSVVRLVLRIDGTPHRVSGVGAPRVAVDATVVRLETGTRTGTTSDGVVLFAAAAAWESVLPGQTVRCIAKVAPAASGDSVVAVVSARGPPETVSGPGRLQRAAEHLRTGLSSSARRMLPADAGGLLPGLVVGDTSALDPVLADDFRSAGLTHLVAVSGTNVG